MANGIGVGREPSGPSIEGPFCHAVHLFRALGDRKNKDKQKKKEIEEKGRKDRKKKRKKREKKRKLQRFSLFSMHFCLFCVNLYYAESSFRHAARLCCALEDH